MWQPSGSDNLLSAKWNLITENNCLIVEVLVFFTRVCSFCLVPSAAAKKAAGANPSAEGEKGEAGEGEKEGVNGEVAGESNGKAKEGGGAASGSKLRACRRAGGGEGSGAGKRFGHTVMWNLCVFSVVACITLFG